MKKLKPETIKQMILAKFPEMNRYINLIIFAETNQRTYFTMSDDIPIELRHKVSKWYKDLTLEP